MANEHLHTSEQGGQEQPGLNGASASFDDQPTVPQPSVTGGKHLDELPTLIEVPAQANNHQPANRAGSVALYNSLEAAQTSSEQAEEATEIAIPPAQRPVMVVRDLVKTYTMGKTKVQALSGVSLDVYPGEFVAIMGPSGSGKSTFMNLMGCLDRPTQGEYWLDGKLVSQLGSDELARMRNNLIGFVFQGFNLLGRTTAMGNVCLPMIYAGMPRREREKRARKVLQLVGLGSRIHHKPSELSGGQQQRVAIARSLVNGPSLLLADEPTGNLDSRTSIEIIGVLQALNEQGLTIVLVTHDSKIATYAKRQVAFLDGRIVRDEPVASPRSAQEEWASLLAEDARKAESQEAAQ